MTETKQELTDVDRLLLDCGHLIVDVFAGDGPVEDLVLRADKLARRLKKYFLDRGLAPSDKADTT
jgi:hypothetical protein